MGSSSSVSQKGTANDGDSPSKRAELRKDVAGKLAKEYLALKEKDLSEEEAKALFMEKIVEYEEEARKKDADDAPSINAKLSRSKSFVENCELMAANVISRGATTFCLCTDGSEAAAVAFRTAINLRRKHDNLVIFHASRSLESASVKEEHVIVKVYKPELERVGVPKDKFKFHFRERFDRSVVSTLEEYVEQSHGNQHPDFVIFGCVGKKQKGEGTRASFDGQDAIVRPLAVPTLIVKQFFSMLGSNTDQALRSLSLPCIIAKKSCPEGPKTFLMAVKSGEHSKRGLDILLRLVGPRDSLRVLHVNQSSEGCEVLQELQEYYTEELKELGPADSEFLLVPGEGYSTVQDAILDQVNGPQSPDFFALAPRARMKMGVVAEELIAKARTSVVLCKN